MAVRTKARSCDGKAAHANRDTAMAHVAFLARERGAAFTRLTPYRCKHCHAWHVGHRGAGRRRQW
jgi:hypothetical protein